MCMLYISLDNGVVTKTTKNCKVSFSVSSVRKTVEMGLNSVRFHIFPFKTSCYMFLLFTLNRGYPVQSTESSFPMMYQVVRTHK